MEGARLERNVMGELNMYRQLGIRPNFTEIGRKYGLDRRTVAKYRDTLHIPASGKRRRSPSP